MYPINFEVSELKYISPAVDTAEAVREFMYDFNLKGELLTTTALLALNIILDGEVIVGTPKPNICNSSVETKFAVMVPLALTFPDEVMFANGTLLPVIAKLPVFIEDATPVSLEPSPSYNPKEAVVTELPLIFPNEAVSSEEIKLFRLGLDSNQKPLA